MHNLKWAFECKLCPMALLVVLGMGRSAVVGQSREGRREGSGQWNENAEPDQPTEVEEDDKSRCMQAAGVGRSQEEAGVSLQASRDQQWNQKHLLFRAGGIRRGSERL